MSRNSFAPGKIILSGEYAVIFGYAGIAISSSAGITVAFEEDSACEGVEVDWEAVNNKDWLLYTEK